MVLRISAKSELREENQGKITVLEVSSIALGGMTFPRTVKYHGFYAGYTPITGIRVF
jgi:hypothetical protein